MPTLLIVDDEPSILKSLERLLIDEESIEILSTVSATEALRILKEHHGKVDLVLSDERMPGLSGSDFLSQVRDLYPNVIRIILTGYADQVATIKAINDAGVYRYVTKPWDGPRLLTTIHEALQIKHMRDRNEELSLKVIGQKNELLKLNESLEQQVRARTDQLKKSLETVNQRNTQLAHQRSGSIVLLNSMLSVYDSIKARTATTVTDFWKTLAQKRSLTLSENGLLAAQISEWVLGSDQSYLHLLSTIEGFEEVCQILTFVAENVDGSGPKRARGDQIPVESRLLRIVHDHFSLHLGQVGLSKPFILARCHTIYDAPLAELVFDMLPHQTSKTKIDVDLSQLLDGMINTDEVKLVNGAILLAAGTVLNQKVINQLQRLKPYLGSTTIKISTKASLTDTIGAPQDPV